MTTTSLKLPDELKSRVVIAAKRAEKSAHAFMLEAIARQVDEVESEAAFIQSALDSLADAEAGDSAFSAEDVHAWLLAKVRGETVPAPKPLSRVRRKIAAAKR